MMMMMMMIGIRDISYAIFLDSVKGGKLSPPGARGKGNFNLRDFYPRL